MGDIVYKIINQRDNYDDTVYQIVSATIFELSMIDKIGKTVFLTQADARNPNMGLNNKPCYNTKYWCRLHQVWLSESDVKRKLCKERPTMDMIGTRRCGNLTEKNTSKT